MNEASEVVVALCTAPVDSAEALARQLVESRVCACVNVLPHVRSFFHWQGALDTADEQLLLIKTTSANVDSLRERIQAWHPYDVPELLVLRVADGLPPYLAWVADAVTKPA